MSDLTKITKCAFYADGGFSNPRLVRLSRSGGGWAYFRRT